MSNFRIGHGYDIHRLQTGGKLVLGGVVVSTEMSPISYSDGDVVVHAIIDALLGGLGWGDIGDHYSDKDPKLKGVDSTILLAEIHTRVKNAGYHVVNADVMIMAERPRISPFKKPMTESLKRFLGAESVVNIKAGTNEECDAVGRGEAIAAHAVVLLTKDG
jgi:2-C-methyl-D-erythritol 2,4-cyclodiphosphate synthase